MVLIRTLALLALTGCLKAKPPVVARASAEVATTVTLATIDQAQADGVPEALIRALSTSLAAHNLQLLTIDAPDTFETRRTTAHRLDWMVAHASTASHVLLVETRALRYGQVSGRYRWAVDVTLTMSPTTAAQPPTTDTFSVPVHLQHAHQGATAALEAAMPAITRRTRRLVDDYLGGAP